MAITWPAKNNYATGDVLTAANMNGIGDDLNDLYNQTVSGGSAFAAGKNKIINGDFGIWQRGTSFSNPASGSYLADRFAHQFDGSGSTRTISQQTFTPGTAPVSGYEGQYFFRYNQSVAGTGAGYTVLFQRIEDVRAFAGQSITFSFWAKASANISSPGNPYYQQIFGTGGSSINLKAFNGTSPAFTTSWQRFTYTVTIDSISGKTIGTGSSLEIGIYLPVNTTFTIDFWGWQLEAGSVATAFQTATGTIQGELAACQRYYFRDSGGNVYSWFGYGTGYGTTSAVINVKLPVTMRTIPTSVDYSTLIVADGVNAGTAVNSLSLSSGEQGTNICKVVAAVTSGLTQYRPYFLLANNSSTAAYVGFSAEL